MGSIPGSPRLPPTKVEARDGFEGLGDATVEDFWRFAMSDLRMNNARGYLAESIVARALGVEDQRIEWAEYDVLFDGVTIEVKSSAYLQSWEQPRLSAITFTGLKGTPYTPRGGYDSGGKRFNAQVYVFGVQTARTHQEYDVLNLNQWDFYVLPVATLRSRDFASISLAALQGLTSPVPISGLKDAIIAVSKAA